NIYIQPFLYLAAALSIKNYSLSGFHKTPVEYATKAAIIILIAFFMTVDASILMKTINSPTDYREFSSEILEKLPEDSTVLVASTPDPYFILKDSGEKLRLYTFVHMGSYPMDESYRQILPEIDYFVFSGTPEKHYLSPYDVAVINEFIREKTTIHTVIGENKDYSAVIYKTI
ncbi:MAG: hypothetical protein ABH851_05150, partial [Methanobacteriota archaeon]